MTQWKPFPYDHDAYDYAGDSLAEAWDELHRGDRVAFPDANWVQVTLETHPEAAPAEFDGDVVALASQLQDAWRSFHAGRFGEAVEQATQCGLLGHAPANKAIGIYAHHLETDGAVQTTLFESAAERAASALQALPDDASAFHFHAFNLGRYSQSVSVVNALRQGIGGRIQESLDRALELDPDHADAHTAYGLYHAEILNKVGRMIGGMTYGASADKALAHFERAIELIPDSPIAHIEYGNGLYLIHGDKQIDRVTELYVMATEMTPRDAMEKLDIESALAELE